MYSDQEAVEILNTVKANEKLSKSDAALVADLTRQVLKRCAKDTRFFFENFITIVSYKTDEHIRFILNKGQRKFLSRIYKANRKHNGKAWVVASKARQAGFTTMTNALMLHHVLFHKNAYAAIIAQKEDTSKKNLAAIKEMLMLLPDWMLAQAIEWDRGNTGRHFDSSTQMSFRSRITDSEVKLQAFSASAKAIRGETPTALHWTETAFCEEAYEMSKAVFPALRRRGKSLIILESTSNGTGNFYADTVLQALEGSESRFELVFNPWYADPEYKTRAPSDFTRTEEEEKMAAEFDLTNDQLLWRRIAIADNGGNVNSFKQEYPATVEESFVATDSLYFSNALHKLVADSVIDMPSQRRIHLTQNGIESSEFGNTHIWSDPVKDYGYVLGVDVAEGKGIASENAKDWSVITVRDLYGRLVLHWRDRVPPGETAAVIFHISRMYNNARIAVERNGIGYYVLGVLTNTYRLGNLYYDTDGRAGFRTQEHSKKRILAQYEQSVMDGKISVFPQELLTEIQTFETLDNGKTQAKSGYHDDCIMSDAICVEVFTVNPPTLIDTDETTETKLYRNFVL